jgi:hypothetical protein
VVMPLNHLFDLVDARILQELKILLFLSFCVILKTLVV